MQTIKPPPPPLKHKKSSESMATVVLRLFLTRIWGGLTKSLARLRGTGAGVPLRHGARFGKISQSGAKLTLAIIIEMTLFIN